MKIFVYGSLKKNRYNHILLGGSPHFGDGVIEDSQYYVLKTGHSFPFLCKDPYRKSKKSIKGEIYEVGEEVLDTLDALEGHPNWYKREKVLIRVRNEVVECETYVFPYENVKNLPETDEY